MESSENPSIIDKAVNVIKEHKWKIIIAVIVTVLVIILIVILRFTVFSSSDSAPSSSSTASASSAASSANTPSTPSTSSSSSTPSTSSSSSSASTPSSASSSSSSSSSSSASTTNTAVQTGPKIRMDLCAYENGSCTTGASSIISYIANGVAIKSFTPGSTIVCDVPTLGDPVPNYKKACYTSSAQNPYLNTFCADEGGNCVVGPGGDVMFRSKAGVTRMFPVGRVIACVNNGAFGPDPIPGRQKACYTGNLVA